MPADALVRSRNVLRSAMCGPYDSAARPAFPGFGRALELPKGVRLGVTNVEARGLWELPIDLDWVATVLEGDPMRSQGAFLDLTTGELIHSSMIDFVAADGEGSRPRECSSQRRLFRCRRANLCRTQLR